MCQHDTDPEDIMTITWTRIDAVETGATAYQSTAGYQVYGSNVGIAGARGGQRTVRRFTAYGPDAKPLPTGEFGTMRQAKAYADEHAAANPTAKADQPRPATARTRPNGARTTTVTHPDGTTSTRTSKTMTYGYAVEVAPAPAATYAADLIRRADAQAAYAERLRKAINYGEVRITSRGWPVRPGTDDDLYSHQATMSGSANPDGHKLYTWCSRGGRTKDHRTGTIVTAQDYLIRNAREIAAEADANAVKLRAEAADTIAKGEPIGAYYVSRWSTRRDLAEKYATGPEMSYAARQGYTCRVVEIPAN